MIDALILSEVGFLRYFCVVQSQILDLILVGQHETPNAWLNA